jgi:hypothetical protein
MATAAMFVLPIPIFLAYLVPLDVNFVGISTVVCGSFWGVEKNSKWQPLPW